jgi:hypothetical protein
MRTYLFIITIRGTRAGLGVVEAFGNVPALRSPDSFKSLSEPYQKKIASDVIQGIKKVLMSKNYSEQDADNAIGGKANCCN